MKKYTDNFTIILNKHITNTNIDVYEFRVLCYLLMLADENSTCYPSYKTISNKIGICETKVKDSINRLIQQGTVKKEKRIKDDGSTGSNLYVVRETTDTQAVEHTGAVVTDTTPCISDDIPVGCETDKGRSSDDYNKYSNTNIKFFINNQSSIEDVFEKAEIDNLYGESYKEFKSAIEKMYNQKYITVSGEKIPQAFVRDRLKNISYEHIAYVDNNMPRTITSEHEIIRNVANPVAYIISSLYNALEYNEQELLKMQYGDDILFQNSE